VAGQALHVLEGRIIGNTGFRKKSGPSTSEMGEPSTEYAQSPARLHFDGTGRTIQHLCHLQDFHFLVNSHQYDGAFSVRE